MPIDLPRSKLATRTDLRGAAKLGRDTGAEGETFRTPRRQIPIELAREELFVEADECFGGLDEYHDVYVCAGGRFSLSVMLTAAIDRWGPARMVLSTWTAANAEITHAYRLMESDEIIDCSWLVDMSFKRRQPAYFARARSLFGPQNVCQTHNHAKFCLLQHPETAVEIVVLTSANLNANRRREYHTISMSRSLYRWNLEWVNVVRRAQRLPLLGEEWLPSVDQRHLDRASAYRRAAEYLDTIDEVPTDEHDDYLRIIASLREAADQIG